MKSAEKVTQPEQAPLSPEDSNGAPARLRLLAEAGTLLASSLDYRTTLTALCRFVVPALGDWCAVDILSEDGKFERLAVQHRDKAKVALAHSIHERYPPDLGAARGVGRVLRTGEPEWAAVMPDEVLVALSRDPEHLEIIRSLGLQSLLMVPLPAEGRILGVLTLVHAESGRHYGPEDVALAQEIARRAGLAVEHARLYGRAEADRKLAESLLAREKQARAEAELQRAITRTITDNASLGLVMMDARQHCTFLNPAAEAILGFSMEEIRALDKPLHDIVHHLRPDGTPYPMEACPIDRSLPTRAREKGEDVFVRRDGSFYPVGFTASPIFREGRPTGTILEVRDLSEERRRQKEQELQFRSIVENLPELAWTAHADGRADYFNERFYEFTGAPYEQVQGQGWVALLEPSMREEVLARWQASLQSGTPFEMEYPLLAADGKHQWFLSRVRPLRDFEGRILRWFATSTNIDQQKRTQSMERRRARQAMLIGEVGGALTGGDSLPIVLHRCAEAIVTHLDAAFARIWLVDEAEGVLVLNASAGLYTHLDGAHGRVPIGKFKIGRIASNSEPHLTNDVLTDPDVGDPAWARREKMVSFAGYPLLLGGKVLGVIAMFARDPLAEDTIHTLAAVADAVSLGIQRKRGEEALRRSEERYQLAVRATKDAIWDWDLRTDSRVWNEGFESLFGHRQDAVPQAITFWIEHIHPEDRGRVAASIHGAIASGEQDWTDDYRFRRADGTFAVVTDRGFIGRDASGRAIRMVGAMQDVTERRWAEREREKLIRSLEVSNRDLDQFAYVASHDLKAPLRGIANLSQWIEEDLGEALSGEGREQMKLLRGRVHRLEGLIDGILNYSRAGRVLTPRMKVNTGELVREALELIAPPHGAVFEVASALPTLETEKVPLQQVFMNLIGNAVKYGPREGLRVEIASRPEGAFFAFSVKDNGPGIAPAFHERIWGIFQTLAARDEIEGTGIGLSVVRKIVESRGGRTWVESEEGQGATFHFTWPAKEERGSTDE